MSQPIYLSIRRSLNQYRSTEKCDDPLRQSVVRASRYRGESVSAGFLLQPLSIKSACADLICLFRRGPSAEPESPAACAKICCDRFFVGFDDEYRSYLAVVHVELGERSLHRQCWHQVVTFEHDRHGPGDVIRDHHLDTMRGILRVRSAPSRENLWVMLIDVSGIIEEVESGTLLRFGVPFQHETQVVDLQPGNLEMQSEFASHSRLAGT